MPHYHFDLENGSGFTRDDEGAELADAAAAREVALKAARSIMGHEVMKGQLDLTGRIMVREGSEAVLFEVGFEEALEIRRG